MIEMDKVMEIIDQMESGYTIAMNNCGTDDLITYHSNQTAVLALEYLKHILQNLENGEA